MTYIKFRQKNPSAGAEAPGTQVQISTPDTITSGQHLHSSTLVPSIAKIERDNGSGTKCGPDDRIILLPPEDRTCANAKTDRKDLLWKPLPADHCRDKNSYGLIAFIIDHIPKLNADGRTVIEAGKASSGRIIAVGDPEPIPRDPIVADKMVEVASIRPERIAAIERAIIAQVQIIQRQPPEIHHHRISGNHLKLGMGCGLLSLGNGYTQKGSDQHRNKTMFHTVL